MKTFEEKVQEFKKILEKEHGRKFTEDEVASAIRSLEQLADILFDHWQEDRRRQKRLEESPKGFVLDGVGYTCFICGDSTGEGENWYDEYGIKCRTCQNAIDKKIIPATLAKNKDSFYTKYDLESRFNLTRKVLNAWIKSGIIKVRTIPRDDNRVAVQIFLMKDNKGFLPPKKMVESQSVKHTENGKDWYRVEPWYKFVDPFEYLKGYRIMEYMQYIKSTK